jgi:ABC-type phosphate/phosphonate transport system substrate-binding protein
MRVFRRLAAAIALGALCVSPLQAAEFRLGIEASYPPEQAQEIYRPLLAYLKKATGHTFVLVVPRNYHFQWRDLRQNAPLDFAFEEAHFIDFRIQRHAFEPLVRTAEPTSYALLASPELAAKGLPGLVGRRIACMPSPSLGFALLSEMFVNPVAQPDIRSEAATWRDGVEMIFADEAESAMVQSYIAEMYASNLSVVQRTRDFPGRALAAAATVDPAVKQAVKDAMLKLHEDSTASEVLNELGTSKFEPTSAAEYAGMEQMLSGFFGYQPRAGSVPAVPPPSDAPADAAPAASGG